MQYQVPHFLETEQHIWGPFTFTNLVVMIGVSGVLAILYFLEVNFVFWVMLSIIALVITLTLMFGSRHGRAFYLVIMDFFYHLINYRRYTWLGIDSEESVPEFVEMQKQLRNLPESGPAKVKNETPLRERFEDLSKRLDQI